MNIALLKNASILVILLATASTPMSPPIAKIDKVVFHEFGSIRIDPYHWLNQRDTPAVLDYLRKENAYTDYKMQNTRSIQKELYNEFRQRIKQDDSTVPYKKDNYYYYVRYEAGKDYPIYCRKRDNLNNPEEIILDVNELAKGKSYYEVGDLSVSPDEKLLAFGEDTVGRRQYTIRVKDLSSGTFLPEMIADTSASMEWANDSKTLFYAKIDTITLRANRIFHHKLGDTADKDKLVYDEKDDTFFVDISKSKSKQYLMIASFKKDTSEFQILSADHPDDAFRVFTPRQEGREYYVDHHPNKFIIRTNNDGAINFKIMQCDEDKTDIKNWQPLLAYDPTIYTEGLLVFEKYLVLQERVKGLTQIKIHPFEGGSDYYLAFDEPDYSAYAEDLPEYHTTQLRYTINSLKTPKSIYDFDMQTKQKVLKKRMPVLGGFDSNHYQTKRVYAKATDGVLIPVSIVYRRDKFNPHHNPLFLDGYGAYGVTFDPDFNPYLISLLDRGFVYAIAHVRGGGEMGRQWYLDGKLLNKKNTFTDFIACAEFLNQSGFADSHRMYATGASAGGLLIGAVLNMQPDLFKGILAVVPFVDLMNTMLDPNIPLTTAEYAEWGDPRVKIYYDYMLSYSPYDNLKPTAYPNMLVIGSYHDSLVQYWEPAKWVARLRSTKTDNHILLLQTRMYASHGGPSSRNKQYQEMAFQYAFLINLERQ